MKQMRTFLSCVLALCLVLGCLPMTVWAAGTDEDELPMAGGTTQEDVTTPTTAPTTEPTTAPTTQPPMETAPAQQEQVQTGGFPLIALILVGIACAAAGAAITAVLITGVGKKKKPGKYEGN